ncbi:MAG: hypothetical protein ABS76_37130 [Pelagibacterium sp. SCN 64-44]|nr:MAG: hypothetical protein ABS76_37130 [Pelagibacterium sp. SCN 64-44]
MTLVRSLRGAAAIAAASILLSACQTLGLGGASLVASTVTAELTPASVAAIAGDMVEQLKGHIGAGANMIRLRGDGSAFGVALEESLRSAGYAVVADKAIGGGTGIELAYVVDEFEGSVLVRLSTASLDLTRIYRVDGSTAVPASPVSVMRRGDVTGAA